jgi:hypothetical protein
MNSGMQYDEVSALFAAHKTEVPDNGFSRRVAAALPDRAYSLHNLPLRAIAVAVGAMVTLAVVFLFGGDLVIAVVSDLIFAACTLSAPSPTSLAIYGGLIALLSTVGFTAYYEA